MRTLLLFLLSCLSITTLAQNNDALKYIKDKAIPIDTAIDRTDTQDLNFLKQALGNRKVIGMGEATHGTHDFQADKFRIFKFLVTEMHFNLFAIEANFTRCRRVNDYILYGKGDAKKAIGNMVFWMWDTKEVLKMVEWMHSYNMDKPQNQKVKFYGIDPQYDFYMLPPLIDNLKKLDSTYFNTHFSRLQGMTLMKLKPNKQQRDSIKNLVSELATYVDNQQANLQKVLPNNEALYTKHDVRVLQQYVDLYENMTSRAFSSVNQVRDKYMCENIKWIMDYEGPDSKLALWAHNMHISKKSTAHGSLGADLKEIYKDDYYALGFDFNKGSFLATDLVARNRHVFTVNDAEAGSSGNLLSQLALPHFFIDIDKAVKENPPAKKFFTQNIRYRVVGDGYTNEKTGYLKDALYDMYDGLIFVNETTAIQPIN